LSLADKRIKPREEMPTDEERIKLHRSMIAYAGAYTVESGKVTHHVDISWNGTLAGTDQVRFYRLDRNVLTLKSTSPLKSPDDGREGVGIVVWEKIEAPVQ
jgi:Lipocalin-like domain